MSNKVSETERGLREFGIAFNKAGAIPLTQKQMEYIMTHNHTKKPRKIILRREKELKELENFFIGLAAIGGFSFVAIALICSAIIKILG